MVKMMNSVVENGTGKRARLDGIGVAGKTGTTNAYRDAWFMGYTGNFVCGVWFGNDDYQSTNRMTGGSLPAMTWHAIMAYAHQGIEIKQLPGIPAPQLPKQPVIAENKSKSSEPPPPPRPTILTKRGADILVRVARLMDDANRAMGPPRPTVSSDKKNRPAPKSDAVAAALRTGIRRRIALQARRSLHHPTFPQRQRIDLVAVSRIAVCPRRRRCRGLATYLALTRGAALVQSWTACRKPAPGCRSMRRHRSRIGRLPTALVSVLLPLKPMTTAPARWSMQRHYFRCHAGGVLTVTLYNVDGELVANSINRSGFSQKSFAAPMAVLKSTLRRAQASNWHRPAESSGTSTTPLRP
jgi:hypothetical protein